MKNSLPCDVCQRIGGLCDFHRKMGFPVRRKQRTSFPLTAAYIACLAAEAYTDSHPSINAVATEDWLWSVYHSLLLERAALGHPVTFYYNRR